MKIQSKSIEEILLHQLHSYWPKIDEKIILSAIPLALEAIYKNYEKISDKRFFDGKNICFSPLMSIQWMNFLYRLSYILYKKGANTAANQVYYLNKILHSVDWFYAIELPTHFMCEHPLGSVLGRAEYGDYFFVYQGTTVGGNRRRGIIMYPKIGKNVILFANASVIGETMIGNNVVISSGAQIVNETVPNNCIVFGKSPNLVIKEKSEKEIKLYTKHIWGWEI